MVGGGGGGGSVLSGPSYASPQQHHQHHHQEQHHQHHQHHNHHHHGGDVRGNGGGGGDRSLQPQGLALTPASASYFNLGPGGAITDIVTFENQDLEMSLGSLGLPNEMMPPWLEYIPTEVITLFDVGGQGGGVGGGGGPGGAGHAQGL